MKKSTKAIAIIFAAVVLFSMLFSTYIIASDAHHDCIGEECPICVQMHVAQNIVNKLSTAIIITAAVLFLCVALHICSYAYEHIIVEKSPIRLKVKMQN